MKLEVNDINEDMLINLILCSILNSLPNAQGISGFHIFITKTAKSSLIIVDTGAPYALHIKWKIT